MADGTQIATAFVQVVPTTKGIVNELNSQFGGAGESAGKAGGNRLAAAFSGGAKAAVLGVGAVVAAGAAATKAIWDNTAQIAEYGDTIDKMSQKMGMSAEAYQEWDFIMQHNGTSMETMKAGMKTLANAVENGNDAFERIGITQEQIASMDNEELFAATISGLQNVDDETERTYLAGQLLGRGATELGALLNMSAEETAAMRQEIHDLGGVMSDDAVKAAAGFQDSLQNLQTGFSGLKNTMMSEFLPATTEIMDGLTGIITGDEGGLALLSQGINDFITGINDLIPQLAETGGQILATLSTAIIDNLPSMIGIGTDIIMSLLGYIIDALPNLIRVGAEIITTLMTNISEALPALIPAAAEAVTTIVIGLTDPAGLSQLVDAALTLVSSLATGIVDALPTLIAAAPTIVSNLCQTIVDNAPTLLTGSVELIGQLVTGIITNLPAVIASAGEIVTTLQNTVIDLAVSLLDAGYELVDQVVAGISAKFSDLVSKGSEIVSKVKEGFSSAVSSAMQWGSDLISNFVSGFNSAWESLKGGLADAAGWISGLWGHSTPDFGPMKDDDQWMPDMMQNFTRGIRDNTPLLAAAAAEAANIVSGIMRPDLSIADSIRGAGVSIQADAGRPMDQIAAILTTYLPQILARPIQLDDGTIIGRYAPGINQELGDTLAMDDRRLATV